MNRLRSVSVLFGLALLAGACGKSTPQEEARKSDEDKLRAEIQNWSGAKFAEKGTSRSAISNDRFVQAVFQNALTWDIPATRDQQFRTGKLVVDRKDLQPGDLVFLQAPGPFRPMSVALYLGHDDMAISSKETGVTVVKLTDQRWSAKYSTARHILRDSAAAAPSFEVAKYGSNTGGLLREIAKAWTGTLYLDKGTTFDGIGNFEYVRAIYEGIYDTELEGTPDTWKTMGVGVKNDDLQPGDIILYQAIGIAGAFGRLHSGMYIGDGDFTHCVKGSAVTISKMSDPRWKKAFRAARRIDHVELTKQEEARAAGTPAAPVRIGKTKGERAQRPTKVAANTPAAGKSVATSKSAPAAKAPPATAGRSGGASVASSDTERKLRAATEKWRGTPYRLGGEGKAGIDCSAFSRTIYKEALAVDLPRTAAEQERLGTRVDRANLVSGDLVFFRTQGMGPFFKSRHVGVYLGDGEFAQASGSHGVTTSRLDDYYWNKKFEGARHVAAN